MKKVFKKLQSVFLLWKFTCTFETVSATSMVDTPVQRLCVNCRIAFELALILFHYFYSLVRKLASFTEVLFGLLLEVPLLPDWSVRRMLLLARGWPFGPVRGLCCFIWGKGWNKFGKGFNKRFWQSQLFLQVFWGWLSWLRSGLSRVKHKAGQRIQGQRKQGQYWGYRSDKALLQWFCFSW